jgi:hypothetical protein
MSMLMPIFGVKCTSTCDVEKGFKWTTKDVGVGGVSLSDEMTKSNKREGSVSPWFRWCWSITNLGF